jgi:DNA-directed RNA polymerase subunit beta
MPQVIEVPNLIDIQRASYEMFLQPVPDSIRREGEPYISDWEQNQREDYGLHAVFHSVFPIRDFNGTSSLEFVSYRLEKPKYDVPECRSRGMTYAAPLKVTIRLVVWDVTEDSDIRTIRDVKEQEVYFGEIPLMTGSGTFIVNGTERVIVSQLHRSPGAFFDHDKGKGSASGKVLYSARIIPYRGSWLDFEFDTKDILHVRIDRRRKMPATVLLRALGYSAEDLLGMYYDTETFFFEDGEWFKSVEPDLLAGQKASKDVQDPDGSRAIVKADKKFSQRAVKRIVAAGITRIPVQELDVLGCFIAEDVFSMDTGEILLICNDEIDEERLEMIKERGLTGFKVLFIDRLNVGPSFRDTLLSDKIESTSHAIMEIYQRLRPGDPPSEEQAQTLFNNLFFNPERYDLSKVGRLKLNHKFYTDADAPPLELSTLTKFDIVEVVRYLLDLKHNKGSIDDIDHLGNRRVRAVGELLENQFRIGLVRMERAIKERMSMSQEVDTLMPHDLINAKPVSAVIKEYFGSSQLSQFMDQTNPLGEVTHKRRLSALGPGGLTRDRAGFEVRDVHTTHYGRICPVETPEGPNIGLIASLATYARVNEYGFIETPYRKVSNGVVSTDVKYYSALEEEGHVIAPAVTSQDKDGTLTAEWVHARRRGELIQVEPAEITLMDVSPNQLVSVAASLIPFLENDDANRALMGSNMQRQAVPLLKTRSPLIGTGVERIVARDSGVTTVALHAGVVESVDAGRIVVRRDVTDDDELSVRPDIFNLTKYRRSNQNTCFNQRPIVNKGDRVAPGDIIADGPSTQTGELALGQNLMVAFMPWGGYNYEDSILISERVVKEDVLTSIHIEEFECVARDTKLGKEEITCDIPNVGEEALAHLDESGIIRLGAEVRHGDILVGKITPKADTQLSPEEKLLRAIFGEKAGDVRDSSLRVPPGVVGTVIGAKVFVRRGADKDARAESIEDEEEARFLKDQNDEIKIIRDAAYGRIGDLLVGKTTAANLVDENREVLIAKGTTLDTDVLAGVSRRYWQDIALDDYEGAEARVDRMLRDVDEQIGLIRENSQEKIERLKRGDELPPGVIKLVKVYVAIKRKLQVGDKMAGRHGNKGVVSRILPEEDMPYLEDGTPVDIVLNPLGVPSRMNVGQVLEVHLGLAASYLGRQLNAAIEAYRDPESWPEELVIELKAKICAIYANDPVQQELVNGLERADLERWIQKVREGCHLATPVFDGASEREIQDLLALAGLPSTGQAVLFDGCSGDAFDHDVTVGIMYILKLHHLVDDKIHARSIGPYSLVTQQPLGGKAQFGGQRVGEMEVWAMEAYGAAYSLQEFLTVKSDDVVGRTRMYESIVKGEMHLDAGLPESFNVLIKELHSLCLNVQLLEDVA